MLCSVQLPITSPIYPNLTMLLNEAKRQSGYLCALLVQHHLIPGRLTKAMDRAASSVKQNKMQQLNMQ